MVLCFLEKSTKINKIVSVERQKMPTENEGIVMARKSQKEMILEYMESGNSITQIEATERFGCTRLASRINELRNEGYDIRSKTKTSKNRYGVTTTYSQYSIGNGDD